MYCDSKLKCDSMISVKVDAEKGLFCMRYVHPPVQNHSSSEIVEMAKEKYGKFIEQSSSTTGYYSVGSEGGDTTNRSFRVLATSRLVTLRRSTRLRTTRAEMQTSNENSRTSSNGEYDNTYENPVKIEDEEDDDNHVFSDQEGDDANCEECSTNNTSNPGSKVQNATSTTWMEENDHGYDYEYDYDSGEPVKTEVDVGDDDLQELLDDVEDDANSQEHSMLGDTTFISPEEGLIISLVTYSLLFEQDRFTNSDGSLQEELEGFLHHTKRLYESID
ncbi:unnamed protein product [Ambrosiozyma monospora]|uniref:Unnamed protein product n=1 Tax=Ambrosiozyma monospora TaxID=43982 RepID=A0ACB5U3C3_AMBMO|nr:unnamed protein product [Ambrosiozyma monospora]